MFNFRVESRLFKTGFRKLFPNVHHVLSKNRYCDRTLVFRNSQSVRTYGPPCILHTQPWRHAMAQLKIFPRFDFEIISGLTHMFVIFDKSCIFIIHLFHSLYLLFFWSTSTVFILILRFFLFLFLSSSCQRLCLTYIFLIFIIFV